METTQKQVSTFEDVSSYVARKLEAKAAKRKEEKEKEGTKQREFVIEKDVTGLYFVRYAGGGPIPDVLKGKHTSISKIEATISKYKASK